MFVPTVCRDFCFEVAHDIHLPNLIFILLGSPWFSLSSVWQFDLFLLEKVLFCFVLFTLLLFTMFWSKLDSLLPVSHICCHFVWVSPILQGSVIKLFLFLIHTLDDFIHLGSYPRRTSTWGVMKSRHMSTTEIFIFFLEFGPPASPISLSDPLTSPAVRPKP